MARTRAATSSPVTSDRRRLARAIHDRVLQQLCGVSIALDARRALEPRERDRCKRELDGAIAALRHLLDADRPEPAPSRLTEAIAAACGAQALVVTRCESDHSLAPHLAALVRDFTAECVRNAMKHGEPAAIEVRAAAGDGALDVAVENDGVGGRRRQRGTGLGLRSLELEALECGGRLEAGPRPGGRWIARLRLPLR